MGTGDVSVAYCGLMTENQTPAGWYPDDQGVQRYWDGTQWTEHVAPAPAAGAVEPVQQAADWGQAQGAGSQLPAQQAQAYSPQMIEQEKSMAMLCHILALFASIIGPLIMYFVARDDQPFFKHHAAEALNFGITVAIALVVSFILVFALIGILLLPVVIIGALVLHIMAAVAANKGEWYRYPISIRMVSGAQG